MKKTIELPEDVVTLARRRVVNLFSNGVPVWLSLSGGKDSIVLAHIVYSLIREGKIDPKQLTVNYIDEEAMHSEVIRVAFDWRKKFQKVGATFNWWCIEVKHFNCFNALTEDESFICWDRRERANWVRPMPKFAITGHPELNPGIDSYQSFLTKISRGKITMTGVRVSESIQRRSAWRYKPTQPQYQPIYDFKDTDIWLYFNEHRLDFPETYLHLYQTGSTRQEMRLSQFFSADTAKVLVKLNEYEPSLMERVSRREPNAYLASLYFDSEMFRRSSKSAKNAAGGSQKHNKLGDDESEDNRTWKERTLELLRTPEFAPYPKGTTAPDDKRKLARDFRNIIKDHGSYMSEARWAYIYRTLIAGDPKRRHVRAMYAELGRDRDRISR